MSDTLEHITIAQVIGVGLVVLAVARFGGRVWAWAVRAVHFVDKLESIEKQVYANGGSSMRDAVDRIAESQAALAQALEAQAEETRELRAAFEQHVLDSARAPRRGDDPPEADFRPVTH